MDEMTRLMNCAAVWLLHNGHDTYSGKLIIVDTDSRQVALYNCVEGQAGLERQIEAPAADDEALYDQIYALLGRLQQCCWGVFPRVDEAFDKEYFAFGVNDTVWSGREAAISLAEAAAQGEAMMPRTLSNPIALRLYQPDAPEKPLYVTLAEAGEGEAQLDGNQRMSPIFLLASSKPTIELRIGDKEIEVNAACCFSEGTQMQAVTASIQFREDKFNILLRDAEGEQPVLLSDRIDA